MRWEGRTIAVFLIQRRNYFIFKVAFPLSATTSRHTVYVLYTLVYIYIHVYNTLLSRFIVYVRCSFSNNNSNPSTSKTEWSWFSTFLLVWSEKPLVTIRWHIRYTNTANGLRTIRNKNFKQKKKPPFKITFCSVPIYIYICISILRMCF